MWILQGWCKNSTEKQIKMLQSDPSPKFIAASEKEQKNIPLPSTSLLQKFHAAAKEWIRTQPAEKARYQRKDASRIHQISVPLVSHNLKLWWNLNFKLSWKVRAEECLMGESRSAETKSFSKVFSAKRKFYKRNRENWYYPIVAGRIIFLLAD